MATLAELYPALGLRSGQAGPAGGQFGGQLGGQLNNLGVLANLSQAQGMGPQNMGALSRFIGQGPSGVLSPPPTGNGPGTGGTDLTRAIGAISRIESGSRAGDYGRRGPETRYGRALGRYQVLPTNVGPWTERWFGRRLTPDQFLASPEAQDAVFRGQFGSYMSRYGNPQDAASMWFTGQPYSVGRTRSDAIPGVHRGLTGEEYVRRFTAGF